MNYSNQPKKLIILNVLEILRKYSDENHPLSQKQISDLLSREYGMNVNRKAIKANLSCLSDFGCDIEYASRERKNARGELETVCTGFYLTHDFSDEELHFLCDAVRFSTDVPASHRRELLRKIKGLSSVYFSEKGDLSRPSPAENKQFFYTLGVIREAMDRGNLMTFHYARRGADSKPHLKEKSGAPAVYAASPLSTCMKNGRCYLIAAVEGRADALHFRIDRIRDAALSSSPAKPAARLGALGSDLSSYVGEHPYMCGGESVTAIIRVDALIINDVFDWFGENVTLFNKTESTVDVRVRANETALKYWAVQYCSYAEALSPASLRDAVSKTLAFGLSKYAKDAAG